MNSTYDDDFLPFDNNKDSLFVDIPLGFKLYSDSFNTDYFSAEKLLKSKKKRRFTSAEKNEDYIRFEKHYYICPNCGNRIPAYKRYFYGNNTTCHEPSKAEIETFCNSQLNLFEEEKPQILLINEPLNKITQLRCPLCLLTKPISQKIHKCSILQNENILKLTCELNDIKDLFALSWITNIHINISSMIVSEILQFDFQTGTVNISLYNGHDKIFSKAILNANIIDKYDACNLLFNDISIRRKIRKTYETISSCKCPFEEHEISLKNLILLTQFVGYNRSFYDAIPFSYDNAPNIDFVDVSFDSISKKLHKCAGIPELYRELALPEYKSIKKCFFEKPELLFYSNEFEALWKIIDEPNYYCRLIKCKRIFEIVASIHKFIKITEYFEMIKDVKGVAWLCKELSNDDPSFLYDGVEYCAMSDSEKQRVKQNYKYDYGKRHSFSVPMPTLQSSIPDCIIDGYQFSWLKSTIDCNKAGKALHNCLIEYSPDNNPVIAMQKEGQYVAAIEIENHKIIQAYAKNNNAIGSDKKLEKVFNKWCLKFNLTMLKYNNI